jgi:hypothetical protein
LASGYLIYHGIRLVRQALGARRESRRASTPLPGDNPYGITAADVAAGNAVMDRIQAEKAEIVRVWGVHPFVNATLNNDPDWENTPKTFLACVTCKRRNDGVVHQPTWGLYPDGSRKPQDVWFRNALVKSGVPEEEAVAWVAAWDAEAARQGIAKDSFAYWDTDGAGTTWVHHQRRDRLTPS